MSISELVKDFYKHFEDIAKGLQTFKHSEVENCVQTVISRVVNDSNDRKMIEVAFSNPSTEENARLVDLTLGIILYGISTSHFPHQRNNEVVSYRLKLFDEFWKLLNTELIFKDLKEQILRSKTTVELFKNHLTMMETSTITSDHVEKVIQLVKEDREERLKRPKCFNPSCSNREEPTLKLKRCGHCKKAKYCSVKCQSLDWVRHKPECNKPN
jgi:hypothetical protein